MTRSRRSSGSNKGKKRRKAGGRDAAAEAASSPPQSLPRRLLPWALAIVGGVTYFLAFCGFGIWPLTFVAQVPLLMALEIERGASTRRRLAIAMLHGFVQSVGGYYWLIEMLETFSGYEGLPNVFFGSVFFVYQGVQMVVLAWIYGRARGRGWPVIPAAIASTATAEWAYPLLFPSYLGSGLNNQPLFIQVADIGGPILVSVVAVLCSAAIVDVLLARRDGRPFPALSPALAVGAVAITLAYGAYRVGDVEARIADAEKLRVGMVQTNMGLFQKREDPYEGQQRNIRLSTELEDEASPDLLVWSESSFNFRIREGQTDLSRFVMTARGQRTLHTPVLFGGISSRTVEGRRELYNTAFLVDGEGQLQNTYDKTFLLAFGEYLPFGDTFPILYEWSPNSGRFRPGDHVRPLVLGEHRLSTLICYEDVLPSFTRRVVREADPHLLVNITNDAWFGDTHEPWVHLALAQFRSVEHHRYMVRTTNSGVSAIIDPLGQVVVHGGTFVEEALHGEVALLDGWTPYQSLGDFPGYLGLLAAAWMAFGRRRRDEGEGWPAQSEGGSKSS